MSRANHEWRREFEDTLPDLREEDIAGSGFAITGYTVHPGLGGDAALARLRERLRKRGLRLMLDFVPNHMALDHPWVASRPEYFVAGTEADLQREPQNYTRLTIGNGEQRVFAYGRDPYFSGWPDTLQLDYSNPATQQAMAASSPQWPRMSSSLSNWMELVSMLALAQKALKPSGRRGVQSTVRFGSGAGPRL